MQPSNSAVVSLLRKWIFGIRFGELYGGPWRMMHGNELLVLGGVFFLKVFVAYSSPL